MRRFSVTFLLLLPFCIYTQVSQDERAIRKVLAKQQVCWNAGDLECFMEGYWKSERLVFIGNLGLTYGWQNILDNYKKSYPDKLAMGKLIFELLTLELLSENCWSVIGKWNLRRENDNPHGHFSLIFKCIGNDWVIVSDHSS